MQAFDLAQAQRAVQEGILAPWQLNQALKVFQMRQNPRASLIDILIELRYLRPEHPRSEYHRPGTERYGSVAQSHAPRAYSERRPAASSPGGYSKAGIYGSRTSQRFVPPTDRFAAGLDPAAAQRAEQRQVESSGRGAFGRYELRGIVARGGMGTVYQAYLPDLDKVVALKALNVKAEDDVDLQRFMFEARSAARLRHPNIVPVHDIGQVGETRYFTMDLVQGKSLDLLVHTNGTYDAHEAARIGRTLGKALAYAHAKGVIHRDIKPGNILVEDKSGEPYLTDFGLARTVESSQQLTKTGFAVGTPNYMAPEQATGSKDLDERADVYGVGALLYSIMTGRPPFQGPNALATMTSVINDPAPSVRAVATEAPEALDLILKKAMAKSRRDRYSSMSAFVAALETFLEPRAEAPRRGFKPWLAMAAGAVILGALGFFGFRAYRAHRQRGFLLSSARQARERGRFFEAQHFLDQAKLAGVARPTLASERSALRTAEARSQAARDRSEKRARAEESRAIAEVIEDARRAEDKGDWSAALLSLTEGLRERSAEPTFLAAKARLLMRLGKEAEAAAALAGLPAELGSTAVLKGRLALLRDRPKEALDHLNAAAVESREELTALKVRALALLGRPTEAQAILEPERGGRAAIDAGRARLDLALATADWPGAIRVAGRLLEGRLTRPERGAALIDRSWARLLNADLDGSRADVERGVRELEGGGPALILAIHIQVSLRRLAEADALVRRARSGRQSAPELQIAAGRLSISQSLQAANQKKQQQAQKLMQSGAQQIRAGLAKTQKPQPTVVYTDLAQAYIRLQQFPQALDYARQASQQSPGVVLTDSTLFAALRVNGRAREALEVGRRASAAQPGNFGLRGQVIDLMVQAGANEEALRWIEECPENWQQNWQMRFKKARALKQMGRAEDSRRVAEGLLKLPDNLHSWAAAIEVCLRFDLGAERLTGYVERMSAAPIDQGHIRAYQTTSALLEAYGELEHFQALVAKIELVAPGSAAARVARARADYQRGAFEQCRAGFRRLIKQRVGEPGIHHGMIGLSFLAEGALGKAARSFGRAGKSQVRVMAHILRLFCLKQAGEPLDEDLRLGRALLEQLRGPERPLAPALRYMLGQKSAEAIEAELGDRRAVASFKLIRGLESAYRGRGAEARDLLAVTAAERGLDPVICALARHALAALDK